MQHLISLLLSRWPLVPSSYAESESHDIQRLLLIVWFCRAAGTLQKQQSVLMLAVSRPHLVYRRYAQLAGILAEHESRQP